MRVLTAREQALYDVRKSALRSWAEVVEGSPDTQRLRLLSHHDDTASAVCRYQLDIYRAFLVEPTGEVAHHALRDSIWGFFREAMRVTPGILYSSLGSRIVDVYDETVAQPKYRNGWRRPTIAADGTLSLTRTLDTEVSEQYFNVADSVVAEFLDCTGGTLIPAAVIADPYPPLRFPDFVVSLPLASTVPLRHELESIGGKPSLTYSIVTNPGTVSAVVSGSTLIVTRGSNLAGDYVGKVKVVDSLGAEAEATVTVRVA